VTPFDNQKSVNTDAQNVYNNPGNVYNNPKNDAQVVYNNPGNVYNDAQNVYNNPGSVYNHAQVVYNNPRVVYNDAQVVYNNRVVSFRVSEEEYERLMREAKENQMDSVSSYLKYLVRKHLHNEEEREKKENTREGKNNKKIGDSTITSPSPVNLQTQGPRSPELSIPVTEFVKFFSSRRRDSKMINTRLHKELYRDIELLASKFGLTPTTFNRIILIWVDMGWKYGIANIDDMLHFTTLVPKLVMPINLNINNIENNVNVDRPPYKYARELEQSRLKARFRALAEEILKGPPKEQKWSSLAHREVEVPLTPEKLAKWLGSKTDQLSSILKRMEKLKIQLTPEEEELLEEVRKKLESMGG